MKLYSSLTSAILSLLGVCLIFLGCTGGNESSTGEVEFWDRLPSILMILSGLIALGSLYVLYQSKQAPHGSDLRASKFATWKWIMWVAVIIFVFGFVIYKTA